MNTATESTKQGGKKAWRDANTIVHQIGQITDLAQLQKFIKDNSLLPEELKHEKRFVQVDKDRIEYALDTMSAVLQGEEFDLPADLKKDGWELIREGCMFKARKGKLGTNAYLIRDETFNAARQLMKREAKNARKQGNGKDEEAADDTSGSTLAESNEPRAPKTHRVATKPAKQQKFEGMEPPELARIPDLINAIEDYEEKRDARMALQKDETNAYDLMVALLKKHKLLDGYRCKGFPLVVIHDVTEKWKVRRAGSEGEE